MFTFRDIRQARLDLPTAITIGNFDGLHLGHQALLDHTRGIARGVAGGRNCGRSQVCRQINADGHPDL